MPRVSVITPFSRGIKELTQILRDFKNQTFQDFEHILVSDGEPGKDIKDFIKKHEKDYNIRLCYVKKDFGNMLIAPGTRPRNKGIELSKADFVCFADDDDRYNCRYLETLVSTASENSVSVVQMSCQESRMYKNGSPDRIVLIPEVGLPTFPMICHVGTPCFMVPRKWALEEPWQHEPEHDFRFIKRIMDKFKPQVFFSPRMLVDVDGLVLRGLRDWVDFPPFYRN